MKRTALVLSILLLAIITAAYYLMPQWFKAPLLATNRALSGLTAHSVTAGAHTLHYLDGGSGEPVVLLHGIFAEKDHWVDFARPLTGRYRVLVPDLPGYGDSGRHADQSYHYAAQTENLRQWLDALGIQRVHLAGNSMGGTIAALFAIQHPTRVASVALIGAPHGIRSPRPSVMDQKIEQGKVPLIAHSEAEFEQMMGLLFTRMPFLPWPILHGARQDALRNATSNQRLWIEQLNDRYLLQERMGQVTPPVLVLWGENDRVFDASGATVLKASLPRAQVQVLPGVGHLPMMETPADTAARYAAFLAALAPAK